jgi:predicted permease
MNDLKFAVRQLIKNPGFSSVGILTLALGIGATTCIFSVVDAVLLRSLPFNQPEEIVQLWGDDHSGEGKGRNTISSPQFIDWKSQSTTFENIAAYGSTALNITGGSDPERLRGLQVSANYLDVFRIKPILGRGFLPEEDQAGKDKVVLIASGLWRRRFGQDPNIIGRQVRLGGENRIVVGVLPLEPLLWPGRDFLVPLVIAGQPNSENRADHWLRAVGRLKSGTTQIQAHTDLNAITKRQNQTLPASAADPCAAVVMFQDQVTGDVRPKLMFLMVAVLFVLLIMCANVASLVLVRASERQSEIAVRTALGADRWRITRQLLTESVLMALLGGMIGWFLASGGLVFLKRLAMEEVPRAEEIALNYRTLAFALMTSIATGLCFGLVPALRAGRLSLNHSLKESARSLRPRGNRRAHGILISTEIAFALVLLMGSGLMLRSLTILQTVRLGFEPKNALSLSLSLDGARYPDAEQRRRVCSQIIDRVEALPGIEAAGIGDGVFNWNNTSIAVEGQETRPDGSSGTDYEYILGHYFPAMGIPLLKGRAFTSQDNSPKSPPVAILSYGLSRKLFQGGDPLAHRVRVFGQVFEVVGVVGDVRQHGMDVAATERLYLPSQGDDGKLVVRTKVAPLSLVRAIRKEIFALDPRQPVSNVQALEDLVDDSLADRRLVLTLLNLFSVAALLLVAVGLYGVLAYSVRQRTREIGIRSALGAQPGDVLKLILGQGMRLVFIGLGLGLPGALVLSRLIRTLLYGVGPADPLTLLGACILITSVALIACWLPARRAVRIDPVAALKYD